ncbi:hypothetical protein LP419_39560 [Massilia sp. H-1]|nr:hypothetical protein LP419_39560 [Massilia sp. H-1]
MPAAAPPALPVPVAIGVAISKTAAEIRDGTVVTVSGGNVVVSAENLNESSVKSSGKQTGGGDLGVGASFALNIGETDTDALMKAYPI